MKKLLPVYLLFLVLKSASAQTTVYHPFPDSNAVWNFQYYLFCLSFGTIEQDNYSIAYSGDTTINAITYQKLFTLGVDRTIPNCFQAEFPGYKGACRQDTSLKKVFYVPPGDSLEQLLYDFTMQVGDTVRGFTEPSSPYADVVQSIDSVLIGADYRKRWLIDPCYSIYYIEGIGSTFGLIEKSPGCITDGPGYSLTCFSQKGQTLYPDTFSNCEIIDAVSDTREKNNSAVFYPNPFHNSAMLKMGKKEMGNRSYILKIYNTLGIPVRDEQILHITSYILHRNDLHAGMYFYELRTSGYEPVGNGKFIIE